MKLALLVYELVDQVEEARAVASYVRPVDEAASFAVGVVVALAAR